MGHTLLPRKGLKHPAMSEASQPQENVLPTMEDAVETAVDEVRSFLVTLRGGAPFLSPFDARLLLQWLGDGVPVRVILYALERTAEARRAKKARTPLNLRHASRAIADVMSTRLPTIAPAQGLAPIAQQLRDSADPLERAAGEAIAALSSEGELLVREALVIARRFHEQAWDRADRAALMAEAEAELGDLAAMLPPERLGGVREEAARELLRRRHPLLSATALWDTVVS